MDDEPQLMVGGVPISSPNAANMNLFMLLWGDSGSGKTTLAATAPGTKLFLTLDPGGELSLANRSDCAIANLAHMTPLALMTQFRLPDPAGIGKILQARPDIETVVVDSMTTLAHAALGEAVTKAGGQRSTIEQPGIHGYSYRNASVLRMTVSLMQLCSLHKRHLILITHEGNAEHNENGVLTSVTLSLSGGVANQLGLRFNEVWHLTDLGTERRIAIRPCRSRKPMKSRLFVSDQPEFLWRYNADTNQGETLADWYHAWQAGGGKKLPLPVATPSKGVVKK